ncbi:protein kinase domain-containing protein [Streptomyces sp. LE64]|uniref:protein kinase domain-containing protein n=1 Tax=Streptomyces sp. LE64 TaxID=3448653 RepID=UPI0040417E88
MGTEGGREKADMGAKSRLIDGRYLLKSRLGRGGMGVVWGAEDQLLGRLVAVKRLDADPTLRGAAARRVRARTLREARAVAALRHPNVVVVHDVVEHDEDAYIVMELVTGGSLADRVAAHGPRPVEEVARIGLALLGALRAAHAAGVLHRDLKPDNVLLEAGSDRVVLTDFGVARVPGAGTLTEDGLFVGSPEYSAPERVSGGPGGPEADLWSLGALLCTALTGRSPFRRGSLSGTLHAVVVEEVRPPAEAGPLLPVVAGLLERDPARRLGVAEAERLLHAALAGAPVPGTPPAAGADRRSAAAPEPESVPGALPEEAPLPVVHPVPSGGVAAPEPVDREPVAPVPAAPARMPRGTVLVAVLAAAVAGAVVAGGVALFDLGRHGDDRPVVAGPTSLRTPAATSSVPPARPAGPGRSAPRPGTTHPGNDTRQAGPRGALPSATPSRAPGAVGAPAAVAPASTPTTAPPAGRAVRAPGGYRLVEDPAGFTLAVPQGFARFTRGERTGYASPDGTVRIEVRTAARHPDGPAGALRAEHDTGKDRTAEVRTTTHRGLPAARWERLADGGKGKDGERLTADLAWQDADRLVLLRVTAPAGDAARARAHLATAADTLRFR